MFQRWKNNAIRAGALVLWCIEARSRFKCCASRETTNTRKRGRFGAEGDAGVGRLDELPLRQWRS